MRPGHNDRASSCTRWSRHADPSLPILRGKWLHLRQASPAATPCRLRPILCS